MHNTNTLCGYIPYPASLHHLDGRDIFITKTNEGDKLIITGENPGFVGEKEDGHLVADLTHENALSLRRLFPFTAPRTGLKRGCSMGVGDRLGIATTGHLRAFSRFPNIFPVFAQQSIRELTLTGRSFDDVLDCVTFAVFREGYESGFGADGDHLKKPEEIAYALRSGYSMITLDSSEHIRGDFPDNYVPAKETRTRYLGSAFDLGDGLSLEFAAADLGRAAYIYDEAIRFIMDMHEQFIKGRDVDFEISIDETMTPTTPLEHYYVASELTRLDVRFASLAPRFCGEFQKGIDYIGDIAQFDKELMTHAAIAKKFGYKLSVHSGSDKFSVFPSVGKHTDGEFHLKTAGTNWLEAVRLIAQKAPALYRRLHEYALSHFSEATKYYHVTTNLDKIPELSAVADGDLPMLMEMNDARQLMHITYGILLTAKKEDGTFLFRDDLYTLWAEYAEDYAQLLDHHIGRHMSTLLG